MSHAAGLDGGQFFSWYKFKGEMVARWDVAPNIKASAKHPRPFPLLPYQMRSFFALTFCGLSLTFAGMAATFADRDHTLAVDAMAAGLVITASAALPGILATDRR